MEAPEANAMPISALANDISDHMKGILLSDLANSASPVSDLADAASSAALSSAREMHEKGKDSVRAAIKRFFSALKKERSMREVLGGGRTADLLLWTNVKKSGATLGVLTALWILVEFCGFTMMTITCKFLMVAVGVLFVWANFAYLFRRAPPPVPKIELKEEKVQEVAAKIRVVVNESLLLCRDVACGKEFKLFVRALWILYFASMIGSWFTFISLSYLLVLLAFIVPKVYETYERDVDKVRMAAMEQTIKYYEVADRAVVGAVITSVPGLKQKPQ
ncbi:hypothetical protein CBR_g52633 [Chara braunii]|uniref:Reticulon-like protein n=1 Tax=Chara braunii TaxID=69332 RepID=A0A388MAW9_CHABU|nr:hypothetical protein CBR_g52633 [Chara braunii]|eukprot:GBG91599.1 hypothetical protein CBR_g52633 [Chara braunii]